MDGKRMMSDREPLADLAAGSKLSESLSGLRKKIFAHLLTGLGNLVIGSLLIFFETEIVTALGFLPGWLVRGAGYLSVGVGGLYLVLSALSAVMLSFARKKLAGLPPGALRGADHGEI